jgi:serine/threonine-protein kinase RsbW
MATSHTTDAVLKHLKLEISGRYCELSGVRQIITDACRWAGLNESQCAQMEMAVDEACTNIIEHSYGGEASAENICEHAIRLHMKQYRDRIVVEIYDHGTGFDYSQHHPIHLDQWLTEKRERGLGLYVITQFVDDVSYERGTRVGNYLRLTKRL